MDESTEVPPSSPAPFSPSTPALPSAGIAISPRQVTSAADARQIVEARGLSHVKVGLFDNDGVMRGKYMSREKFFSALDHGFAFCDVVLGWDVQDQLYDNARYTGWHTGYPDAPVRILPQSCRELPFEDGMLLFLAEFCGAAEEVCPRALLRRVIERCERAGFAPYAALEYEFFLFDETPDSARAKGYRDLKPFTPGWFGYSMIRNSVHADIYHEILDLAQRMDFPIEGLHTETGPGVLEAAITVDQAEAAADKAALFKTFVKVLAQRRGLMATFMAKWSNEYPGQSGHIHLSLRNKADNKSAFYAEDKPHGMSEIQRHFLAGQQRLMPELLSMVAPTVNSYRRMIPGFWAPTDATWGVENRTAALRVIPGSDKSQRQEYRLGAADANPYLALAVALGSGIYGIEQGWEPGAMVTGSAYAGEHPPELALPRTLWDAAQRLKKSEAAKDLFGDAFVEHFAASREWEEREFRKHIGDWELQRYFEII
ncbi:glutamine synthetase [Microbulbifer bruguierae]|uniref:Glutamine synthetase n=1 Tax=Microbulbifer bruguierae TaxID=3029061 RepID=A0ABY8NI16_9GAMM|nr:glutamine synthetase [Microbulbifer bruguierae]WGL18009.1 glutamine synthetase [Microbulbifer bruguierae]